MSPDHRKPRPTSDLLDNYPVQRIDFELAEHPRPSKASKPDSRSSEASTSRSRNSESKARSKPKGSESKTDPKSRGSESKVDPQAQNSEFPAGLKPRNSADFTAPLPLSIALPPSIEQSSTPPLNTTDFFKPRDRLVKKEFEGACLFRTAQFLHSM